MRERLKQLNHQTKRVWHFFWEEDSFWSWTVNLIVAFIIIRFIFYPVLGVLLGTGYPIVAVVSESMEHGLHDHLLCGQQLKEFPDSFDHYWKTCGNWYEQQNITSEQFREFPFKNGFYKGDVIILWRAHHSNLKLGDVLVFQGNKPQPIIHRIVKVWEEDRLTYYQTKGDHNSNSISGAYGETSIGKERIYGKGIIRVPYLGWVKIIFVELVRLFGINIQR